MKERRVRRSRDEWLRIMEAREEFGGSVMAFCAANGICYGTFRAWEKRLGIGNPTGENESFLPVKVVQSARSSVQAQMTLPGGVMLELASLPDPHWLAELSAAFVVRHR